MKTLTKEKIVCSWEDFDQHITNIERQLLTDDWTPDYIVGVKRGGLIPAIALSHRFNKPLIMMSCQLRDSTDNNVRLYEVNELNKNSNILIVDDICDSGKTFHSILDELRIHGFKFARTCALFFNVSQNFCVHYKSINIDRTKDKRWIFFPWEAK
jgi:adenine/guanine phosphoribosyltransferase-like PRPP-binding protein